jgi:hypothetical protein
MRMVRTHLFESRVVAAGNLAPTGGNCGLFAPSGVNNWQAAAEKIEIRVQLHTYQSRSDMESMKS